MGRYYLWLLRSRQYKSPWWLWERTLLCEVWGSELSSREQSTGSPDLRAPGGSRSSMTQRLQVAPSSVGDRSPASPEYTLYHHIF